MLSRSALIVVGASFMGSMIALDLSAADEKPPVAKVLNLERVNTSADEDDPHVSSNNLSLFYTSNSKGDFDVMVANRKTRDQPWGAGMLIEDLSGKGDDVSPFLMAPDADRLEYIFFASKRGAKNFDIFFTRRLKPDQPFMRIAVAGVNAICTSDDERDPWLTADGKEMFFSRKTADGWRIGFVQATFPRAFEPEKVKLLDLPAGMWHPTVTRDGLTMYMHGQTESLRMALFVSKRKNKNAAWDKPVALKGLTSDEGLKGDRSPSLSPDGAQLYFASDRPTGKGGLDLYAVTMAELKKAGN